MREEYSFRPQDIHRDFDSRQKESALAIFRELLPFLKSGEVTTILDIGCGSGEILKGVYDHIKSALHNKTINLQALPNPTPDALSGPSEISSAIRLVGMDSSQQQIQRAPSTADDPPATELSLTFSKCDPTRSFLVQLAGHGIVVPRKTVVICVSHTIFHLPYLAELFDGLAKNPDSRPLLWLVDIFHSWDSALEYLDKNPKGEFLEPIGFRDRDSKQIVDTLFTRLVGGGYVERGLQEVRHDGGKKDTAVTCQLRWTTRDLRDQFFRCGYSLRSESISLRGWGEMKAHLFSIPPNCVGVSDILFDSNETSRVALQRKNERIPDSVFATASQCSPVRSITNWVRQSNAIASPVKETPDGNDEDSDSGPFDFILIEYAPWYEMWKGRENLFQEISLISRPGAFDGLEDSSEVIFRYNGAARSFQLSKLGMFLHPYLTEGVGDEEWGAITSSFHLSMRSEKCRAPRSGARPATREPADGKNLFRSPLEWRKERWDDLEKNYSRLCPEESPYSDPGPPITTYARSRYRQFEQKVHVPELVKRIENYHDVKHEDASKWAKICRKDYEWTIELFHIFVREKCGFNAADSAMRTFLISAPLRLNREITASLEPRGGIWIFAGTRANYEAPLTGKLRNLLRECLLVGSMAVEASASRSAEDGIRHYAAQSASAAIMSRNMSHNIGSHPLAALTTPAEVDEAGNDRTANFLGYIRSRMDYIASICTDVPRWALTADLRDILEGFTAENDKGKPPWLLDKLTELNPKPNITWDGGIEACPFLSPHGVVGEHALFSIFENVLRNSEKHGVPSSLMRGQARLRIDNTDPNFLAVTLVDCGSCADESLIKSLRERLAEPFYVSEGEQKGELNRNFWGLKEMRISAAYLRMQAGQSAETFEGRLSTRPNAACKPWIEPLIEICEDGQRYLGWKFFLLKPQMALIIGDDLKPPSPETQAECGKYGIGFYTVDELTEEPDRDEKLLHSFLVVSKSLWDASHDDLARLLGGLPLRRIMVGGSAHGTPDGWAWCQDLELERPGEVEERLYECWNRMLSANSGILESPVLALATKDPNEKKTESEKEKKSLPYLVGTSHIIAKQKSVSEADEALTKLLDSKELNGRRVIAFERHADEENGIYHFDPGCCFKDSSCNHDSFWARAQALLGIKFGTAEFQLAANAEMGGVVAQRLIEAGLVHVVVIDDREAIQRLVASDREQKKYAAAGTTIIRFDNPANIAAYEIAAEALAKHVKAFRARFKQAQPGMVIITIHQTILDKLKSTIAPADWLNAVERELPVLLRESAESRAVPTAVVIHSGRGRSGDMFTELRGRRFLEFSNVQSLLESPGQKALLADVLLSVRA